jgi:hypothetical protein
MVVVRVHLAEKQAPVQALFCHAIAVLLLLPHAGTAPEHPLTGLERVSGDKSDEAPYAARHALDSGP